MNIEGKQILDRTYRKAKNNNFRSLDVSDLFRTKYYQFFRKQKNEFIKNKFLYPYSILAKNFPGFVRRLSSEKNFIYAQGLAKLIYGLCRCHEKGIEVVSIKEIESIGKILFEIRSDQEDYYGWGQPFDWQSNITFPKNTPRATVSSQVGWAFYKMYSLTSKSEYLDICESICDLFIHKFNYTKDEDGDFCLSYTTLDNFHIHNASMLAAAFMMQISHEIGQPEYRDFAMSLANYTIKHQNKDGSFYYWGAPNKVLKKIDNYHTGFVLDALHILSKLTDKEHINFAYRQGMEFYVENLFNENTPKMTPSKIYPIDIQSCAQSIFTLSQDGSESYRKLSSDILDFTCEKFFIRKSDHFAYRIYKNGSIDKSYYFRWGDAWMIQSIAELL